MSAKSAAYLLPRCLQPVGPVRTESPRFAWQWEGPEVTWELVLLDEALDEIARVPGIRGLQIAGHADLDDAVAGGGTFFWFVTASLGGRSFRSLPVAATFRR